MHLSKIFLLQAFKLLGREHWPLEFMDVRHAVAGREVTSTLFSSMMFPDRAPNDQYLYATFVGGSHNRDLARAPTTILKQLVTSDLRKLLGVEEQPTFVKYIYWRNAFPLYGRDYNSVLESIEKMEKNLPGFFDAGKPTNA